MKSTSKSGLTRQIRRFRLCETRLRCAQYHSFSRYEHLGELEGKSIATYISDTNEPTNPANRCRDSCLDSSNTATPKQERLLPLFLKTIHLQRTTHACLHCPRRGTWSRDSVKQIQKPPRHLSPSFLFAKWWSPR